MQSMVGKFSTQNHSHLLKQSKRRRNDSAPIGKMTGHELWHYLVRLGHSESSTGISEILFFTLQGIAGLEDFRPLKYETHVK
jgi:hypothetical protein